MGASTTRPASASERLDPAVHERLPADFRAAIDFHGHLCPGLTMGYRAATLALRELGVSPGSDEQLVGIVENDACGVDAFQFLTGCTLGKGNLIYRDYGKQAFTLARRDTGVGVRVVMRPDAFEADAEHAALRDRVMGGQASEDERALFWERHIEQSVALAELPEERFASVAEVQVDLPPKARIFESVLCSVCGEAVMEPRSRVRGGDPCCIPCSTRYGRGWEINE
jgi:formylmethanofuran dehydrogenase subunit E